MTDKKMTDNRTRDLTISGAMLRKVENEDRTLEVAFASETPCERWFGYEILSLTAEAMDLSRLNSGGAFLVEHDTGDQVGVVVTAWIDKDKVARANIKFSQSARGQEIYQDMLDGIRCNISFAYTIESEVCTKGTAGSPDVYTVTKFTPLEISVVAIPADPTVGVGRSLEIKKENDMPEENQVVEQKSTSPVIVGNELEKLRKEEATRTAEIRAMARKVFGNTKEADDFIDSHVSDGTSIENVRKILFERMSSAPHRVAERSPTDGEDEESIVPAVFLGLSKKEKRQYSLMRLFNSFAVDSTRCEAGFELECSREIEKQSGRKARGVYIPIDIYEATYSERGYRGNKRGGHKRGMNLLSPEAGGALVQTSLLSQDLITMLRASSVTASMGARYLTGLRDNLTLPRQTSLANAYWVGENESVGESSISFDQIALNRRTLGTFTDISRGLRIQSSIDIEAFIMSELMSAMALGLDNAALNGDGTGHIPKGIFHTEGITTRNYTTNPSFLDVVTMEGDLIAANAYKGTIAYVTTAPLMVKLKTTVKATNQGFIWDGSGSPEGTMPVWGQINSHRALASTQIPAGKMIFGDWSELIFGFWSGLDVMVNPYVKDLDGGLRVRVMQDVGLVVRRPQSFSILQAA